jgi:hypothetical protein
MKERKGPRAVVINHDLPVSVHLDVAGRQGLNLEIGNHPQNPGQMPLVQLDHGKAQPSTPAKCTHPLFVHLPTMPSELQEILQAHKADSDGRVNIINSFN